MSGEKFVLTVLAEEHFISVWSLQGKTNVLAMKLYVECSCM